MATGAFGQGKNEAPMFQFTCHLIRVFCIMTAQWKNAPLNALPATSSPLATGSG